MPTDPHAWIWTRTTYDFESKRYTEWNGVSAYHAAVVTDFASAGSWQATMSGTDQRSPYRASAASAKAWAERYGKRNSPVS